MKKGIKRVISLGITSILICAMCLTTWAADFSSSQENIILPADSVLIDTIQDVIDAYNNYYTIHSVTITDKCISDIKDDSFEVDFVVELGTELKYDSATQLPHVRAMAEAIGINSLNLSTSDFIRCLDATNTSAALAECMDESMTLNTEDATELKKMSKDAIRLATNITVERIADFVTELEDLYIGKIEPTNIFFRATFDNAGIPIAVAPIALDGTTYDISLVGPSTETEMQEAGVAQLQNIIDTALVAAQNPTYSMRAAEKETYHRIKARDYANTWTSNPANGAFKDTSKWKISSNPNATEPYWKENSSDCANYVSQAMHEGGIKPSEDRSVDDKYHWYASSSGCSRAWESCTNMQFYFTYNNYWTQSDYDWCNAGGIIFCKDDSGYYHVVMCVQNDTVTRKYSGHTADKKSVEYSGPASFGTRCKSLEYWVFTNSSDD